MSFALSTYLNSNFDYVFFSSVVVVDKAIREAGEAEAGKTVLFYMIDEKYRNRDYATQCAVELINYVFEDMEYDIIYGGCERDNLESYRVLQKAGMKNRSRVKMMKFIWRCFS